MGGAFHVMALVHRSIEGRMNSADYIQVLNTSLLPDIRHGS